MGSGYTKKYFWKTRSLSFGNTQSILSVQNYLRQSPRPILGHRTHTLCCKTLQLQTDLTVACQKYIASHKTAIHSLKHGLAAAASGNSICLFVDLLCGDCTVNAVCASVLPQHWVHTVQNGVLPSRKCTVCTVCTVCRCFLSAWVLPPRHHFEPENIACSW